MIPRSPRASAPALILLLVAGLAGAALGFLTADDSSPSRETSPASGSPSAGLRGVVQQLSGDSLRLTAEGGPAEVKLRPDTVIEALRPVELSQVRVGDWLNAGAVSHAQTVFALLHLVFIAQDQVSPPR